MKNRTSKPLEPKKRFNIEHLLQATIDELNTSIDYIDLTFLSFSDSSLECCDQVCQVETLLLKIPADDDDTSSFCKRISLGKSEVPVNLKESNNCLTSSTLRIPAEGFVNLSDAISSHVLLFLVQRNVKPVTRMHENRFLREKNTRTHRHENGSKLFGGELTVSDKKNYLLSEGIYEVPVGDFTVDQQKTTCESLDEITSCFEGPILKFEVKCTSNKRAKKETIIASPENNIPLTYQFTHKRHRQSTEPSTSLLCPWCKVSSCHLYRLLKHLRLCHPRLNFLYIPASNEKKEIGIDVTINLDYDSSNEGSSTLTTPPTRKTPVTRVLVCRRPKCNKLNLTDLSEFLQLNDIEETELIHGHNRTYHHSTSGSTVFPAEISDDSEKENDPEWLRNHMGKLMNEFTDVNEGEKEIMKMWNLHVLKHGFVGDCQMAKACDGFVQQYGDEVIAKNLYRNFLLHISNLSDFGLISSTTVHTCTRKLQYKMSMLKLEKASKNSGGKCSSSNKNVVKERKLAKSSGQKLKRQSRRTHYSHLFE